MLVQIAVNALVIGVSFLILNWASNLTIHNACKLADVSGLGKTTIGFSIIGFLTNLPELTVASIAAFSGGAAISVGNVLGANIAIICVILGLAPLAVYITQRRKSVRLNGSNGQGSCNIVPCFAKSEWSSVRFGLLVSSVVPIVLIFASQAGWLLGLALIILFVAYTYRLSKVKIPQEGCENVSLEEKGKLKQYLLFTVGGAIGVVVSAYFLVDSAIVIAQSVGIAQAVIGATVIAFGTTLPELVLDLKLFSRNHGALAIGDIVGSSFVNITVVLGVAFFGSALAGLPIQVDVSVLLNLAVFSIIANLFFVYFLLKKKISPKEGVIFLVLYALFLYITLAMA